MKCGEGWEASSEASFRRRRWEGDVISSVSLSLLADVGWMLLDGCCVMCLLRRRSDRVIRLRWMAMADADD